MAFPNDTCGSRSECAVLVELCGQSCSLTRPVLALARTLRPSLESCLLRVRAGLNIANGERFSHKPSLNMATKFTTDNLLRYDAQHRVLICHECRYAVQKSALDGHLLRHKIYRGARQRLLSSIATLKVLEPDAVQPPPLGSAPIDGLPVLTGFRCAAPGCESLYVSSKRMRRHWADVHRVGDPPDPWSWPTQIQTFFRGTKLRYFEVAASTGETAQTAVGAVGAQAQTINTETSSPPEAQRLSDVTALDLHALTYFHHYLTSTSLTLPGQSRDLTKYWQTDVITRSLRESWVMSGVLAISARHCAALSPLSSRTHIDQSDRYLQDFSVGWEKIKRFRLGGIVEKCAEDALVAVQLACVHCCCEWLLEPQDPIPIRLFTDTIRGCFEPEFAFRSAVGTYKLPETSSKETRYHGDSAAGGDKVPASISECIRSLPLRMTTAVGKPKTALDFFAALAAIEALTECCSMSYASDDIQATWSGMVAWLARVSEHFMPMVLKKEPSALVVLAHWLFLVARAEEYCWFLRGCADRLRHQIVADLPMDEALRQLIPTK